MSNRDSFILYSENEEIFDRLSDEEAGQLIKAIFDYQRTGEVPELPRLLEFIMLPIKSTLDRNAEKYEKIVEKRRQAGSIGGKTTQANASQNKANASESEQVLEKSSKRVANQAEHVHEHVNDNVHVHDNDNETTTTDSLGVVVYDDDGSTNIWGSLSSEEVEAIYHRFGEDRGFDLIDAVHDDVKERRAKIKRPYQYVIGCARKLGLLEGGAL